MDSYIMLNGVERWELENEIFTEAKEPSEDIFMTMTFALRNDAVNVLTTPPPAECNRTLLPGLMDAKS